MINDQEFIDYLFDQTMQGNGSIMTSANIAQLNRIAYDLYNIPELSKDQIDSLKKIIMICNALYNDTTMTILPIEDGFYDQLLEKYKVYDEHFQVGATVIEFKGIYEARPDKVVATCPVTFFEQPKHKNEIAENIYNEIMQTGKFFINADDFRKVENQNTGYITKRTHNTSHNHPSLIGTLDKSKFVLNQDAIDAGVFNDPNVKVLERDFFQDHIKKGIIRPDQKLDVVVELKYDGISVEADCTDHVISARSRGDTGIGEAVDYSPILAGYPFHHAQSMKDEKPIGVKFEAIMTKSNLYYFNQMRGRGYANCRTAIIGLTSASDAGKYRDFITLVPLAVDRDDTPYIENRQQEIEFLNRLYISHGQPLRYCYFSGTVQELLYLIKLFWDEAKVARDYLDFMYDGIVVSYLDEGIRAKLGRKNFINQFSQAVKFDPLEKQTIFRGYSYEVGQDGRITPMLHYDPVSFNGTIHTKSTGSSFDRFQKLDLRIGDYIDIKYVNDVMPYVSKLDCDANRKNTNPKAQMIDHCPVCGSKLVVSDSGKLIYCPNQECPARSLKRMTNMLSKLNIKGFAEATLKQLSVNHLYELAMLQPSDLDQRLGTADSAAMKQIISSMYNDTWNDYMIMGALGFSGLSRKKWQVILQHATVAEFQTAFNAGFDVFRDFVICLNLTPAITKTLIEQWEFFAQDIQFIVTSMHLIDTKGNQITYKKQIRFTGFRNPQLCEQLNTAGYDADDGSITKKTDILLVPYAGFASGKVDKALKYGAQVIPVQQFLDNTNLYLGEDLRLH